MLSLTAAFWIMVFLFAFVGMMRGWTKEIVVTSAVILALFTINQFMSTIFGFIGWDNTVTPPPEVRRWEFFVMSAILLSLAFFGYQGPTLARSRVGDRLSRRDNLQDRVLGFLVGGTNGWLIVGTVWAFLENKLVGPSNWLRYTPDVPYPFNPTTIVRPAPELAPIIDNLPIPILTQSPYILPLLLVLVFLFVLVVLL
jgi:hypothetical protein